MSGYTSCLTAAIAHQLMVAPQAPNIDRGIQNGLAAIRALHLAGNGTEDGAVTFPLRRWWTSCWRTRRP